MQKQDNIKKDLPAELVEAQLIASQADSPWKPEQLGEERSSQRMPLMAYKCGGGGAGDPCLMLVGGVHGLERIGSQLVVDFMRTLATRLIWDKGLQDLLAGMSIHAVPAANPHGLAYGTRSNAAGIDLMRNAPIQGEERGAFFAGGQRISPRLPWFRGRRGEPMQEESKALIDWSMGVAAKSKATIVLDCHSGYGSRDSVWFPYAHTRRPFESAALACKLSSMLEGALPHHGYRIGPQSEHYLAHGDLWDHAYAQALAKGFGEKFLPLTLEMGSWAWIRKNPGQALSRLGLFNPVKEHRVSRVLRRHASLLDFLSRAASAMDQWSPSGLEGDQWRRAAQARWWP